MAPFEVLAVNCPNEWSTLTCPDYVPLNGTVECTIHAYRSQHEEVWAHSSEFSVVAMGNSGGTWTALQPQGYSNIFTFEFTAADVLGEEGLRVAVGECAVAGKLSEEAKFLINS